MNNSRPWNLKLGLILGIKTCEAHKWRKTKTIAYSETILHKTKKTSSDFYTEDDPKLALQENSLKIKFEVQDFASQVSNKHAFKILRKKGSEFFDHTVQPKNNAHARSAARTSCAVRTRNLLQEVKMSCFCGLPARTFETQEVESLTARSRKKLKIQPQEAARTYESYRKPQEGARCYCRSNRQDLFVMPGWWWKCSALACKLNFIH